MPFIIVDGTVDNVMRSRFNIKIATANWIQCILKTIFEFVFAQMTKANTQSCNEFDSSMIFTIKNIISLQKCVLESLTQNIRIFWFPKFNPIY